VTADEFCYVETQHATSLPEILSIGSEPGLRGELLASRAEESLAGQGTPAVWSEATEIKA
jgi:hypothetical protein